MKMYSQDQQRRLDDRRQVERFEMVRKHDDRSLMKEVDRKYRLGQVAQSAAVAWGDRAGESEDGDDR